MLQFAGFELDYDRAELRGADGQALRLRPKAFATLHLLAKNPGKVFSKQELMALVWPDVIVSEDNLFQCIREIRTALGDGRRQLVRQIQGRGYMLEAKVSAAANGIAAAGLALHRPATAPLVIAMAMLGTDQNDPLATATAAGVIGQLTHGLSHVGNLRVLAPPGGTQASALSAVTDSVLEGNLARHDDEWTLQARLVDAQTTDVRWSGDSSAAFDLPMSLQQSRLAAGVGHPLAVRLNALACAQLPSAPSKFVVEQATAAISHTEPGYFATAQAVLEEALASTSDDIEVKAALADHLVLGIRTVWFGKPEAGPAERRAQAILEEVLGSAPNYLPALAAQCRLFTATNRFVESLVACAKVLSLDPWDGTVMYHLGMSQLYMGRFEDAFDTFQQANAYNTPEARRWSWLFGSGFAKLMLDQCEEALPWLNRALGVIPNAHQVYFVVAAACHHLGQVAEAKAAMAKGFELRPETTVQSLRLPYKNVSPRFIAAAEQVLSRLREAGVPER